MAAYREIRALFDDECITVYQAYNSEIAEAAVREQNLSASPSFRSRMTWIKPSFCWMMYRCGYSYKDENQERVLAIRMKHENFEKMLRHACLAHQSHKRGESVVVQWDPERSPRIGKLDYRSLQVGIPPPLLKQWIEEWIESISDVTDMARSLKEKLDQDKNVNAPDLVDQGLLPRERVYEVSQDIRESLEMS
jgi:hypothetical protein